MSERKGEEEMKKCGCAVCRQARFWKAFARLETAIVSSAGKNQPYRVTSHPARKAERSAP
jgi:hypothetical protein